MRDAGLRQPLVPHAVVNAGSPSHETPCGTGGRRGGGSPKGWGGRRVPSGDRGRQGREPCDPAPGAGRKGRREGERRGGRVTNAPEAGGRSPTGDAREACSPAARRAVKARAERARLPEPGDEQGVRGSLRRAAGYAAVGGETGEVSPPEGSR